MLLSKELILEVLAAWSYDQNHPNRGRSKKPIIDERDMSVLLSTMFTASLLREEGRPVSTSVTWVSRSDFDNHEIGRMRESRLALEFDTPIAFEARNLAKLNGIANGKTSSILACRIGSESYVWGICFFMGSTSAIGEIPTMLSEVRHLSPDYPTVTVTGVGSMQITRGGTVIGRIESGRFLKAHATVLTSFMLGQFLYHLIGIEVDIVSRRFRNEEEAEIAGSFLDCLDFIIEILSQRRTGATLILVPSHLKKHALSESETAWNVQGTLEIDQLQRARRKYQKIAKDAKDISSLLLRLKIDQAMRYRLRSIVDLAGIDGAMLLEPSFEVIGFGMKLKSKIWEKGVQHGPVSQPIDKQELDFSRLGTRHNSALNFVGSVEGAVAFVASTDGPIRALVRSAQDIWYWPDCRVSMFAK